MRMHPHAERAVRSIAVALEANATYFPTVQGDLFGGHLVLEPTPYSQYHAELARRVCVRELGVAEAQR